MSPQDDRVAVPTNGHQPAIGDEEGVEVGAIRGTERGTATPRSAPSSADRAAIPTVSPGQLAVGFGIIAAVILLLLGRRRGRRD